jgi:hypothetical protein
MARKKKVNELKQAHGKEEKFQPTSLDQVWGDEGLGKYKTLDLEKYDNFLTGLTKTDIQKHAAEIGIVPIDNRDMLKRKLVGEFKKHVAGYRKPPSSTQKESKPSKDVVKILREGR